MAQHSENPKENGEDVRALIPLRSRSDSVAGIVSESYAIALPHKGGTDRGK
jgi:hypothetical protein